MTSATRRISAAEFVRVAELLEHAWPKESAVPDYLSHDCERAEQALLSAIGRLGYTGDAALAQLLGLTHAAETSDS